MKRVAVLGSTGSVGTQTLDVIRAFPDSLQVVALSAGRNEALLQDQVREFGPRYVHSGNGPLPGDHGAIQVSELHELAGLPEVDLVVVATVGGAGLAPTVAALEAGKPVALANKEVIVMAGEEVMATARRTGTPILPVDSEPSAIWQCMAGESSGVRKLIITASGGAFRGRNWSTLRDVSPEEALRHPTWRMGRKITIDSATLANKAFEVIEAHYLFDIPYEQIEVVIHHQSIIHSMVEFTDGSVKAQICPPDMRYPIQYALFYPDRTQKTTLPAWSPATTGSLTFEDMDHSNVPCFDLILEHAKRGGTWPAAVSGADEAAVELFLDRRIGFTEIPTVIRTALLAHEPVGTPSIDDTVTAAAWAHDYAISVASGAPR